MFKIGKYLEKKDKQLELDPNVLTKHAVVVGATGSGKTVLCKSIIEECTLNNIPVIAIDPKGDISTLGIVSEKFDFRPYSDTEAKTKGTNPEKYAEEIKDLYEKETNKWGIEEKSIAGYKNKINLTIYTPKSTAGNAISIAPKLSPPKGFNKIYKENHAIVTELIEPLALSLLRLVGYSAKSKKEHSYLTQIILHTWEQGADLELDDLIKFVEEPPFEKIGALDLDKFISKKDRAQLASNLNLLLSMPSLNYWFKGEQIDFDKLFSGSSVSVIDLRWIDQDKEKQFFVERFLQEMYKWLIKKSGTEKLRYLFYFDEIKGYLPSTSNPPSKIALDVLVRQGRAFGLGCLFATQNPGDIDYKILSNVGTRFIGSLRTGLDIEKVSVGIDMPKKELQSLIAGLETSEFIYNNALKNTIDKVKCRWLMSFHRGPLTEQEIGMLMGSKKKQVVTSEKKIISMKEGKVVPLIDKEKIIKTIQFHDDIKLSVKKEETISHPWLMCKVKATNEGFGFEKEYTTYTNLESDEMNFNEELRGANIEKNPVKNKQAMNIKPEEVVKELKEKVKQDCEGKYYINKISKSYSKDKDEIIDQLSDHFKVDLDKGKSHLDKKYGIDIKEAKKKLQKLETEITHLNNEIKLLKKEIKGFKKQKKTAKSKVALNRSIQSRKGQIDRTKLKIKEKSNELNILKKTLKQNQSSMGSELDQKQEQFKNNVEQNIKEIEFDPTDKDLDINKTILWTPETDLELEVKARENTDTLKFKIFWNKVDNLNTCSKCRKHLTEPNQIYLCTECGKTFCEKHIHVCEKNKEYVCKDCGTLKRKLLIFKKWFCKKCSQPTQS